ncbi:MAG: hypothetical protein II839_07765 [Kiritimatiellae bacterium]|nr:hypothetical protein [Kiritimatiellia bacterium]
MKNKTNGLLLAAAVACAALAAGCKTAGPWERHFRPTAAAPAPVPEAATIPPESVRTATFDPVEGAAAALARLAAPPAGEGTDGTNETERTEATEESPPFVELGRSAFVASRASRESAVAFATRLGADTVLFSVEDLGVRWEHTWADPDPFWPPPPPPRYRRGGPPPRWRHRPPPDPFWMDRDEWRPVHLFRFFALFLRTQPAD